MCERIQLKLQAFSAEALGLKMRKEKQTLLMISGRFMTVVLSGALTVFEGCWSPCTDGSVWVPHPARASQFSKASGSHPRRCVRVRTFTCNQLEINYHIIQDLDIAFSFRHLASIRVEQERQMRIFWRG